MFLCVHTHGICVCRCVPVYKDQKIVLGNMDLIFETGSFIGLELNK